MEQQRALDALAPYIALAKSATSPRAAADLVTQATSAPNTYVFAELLQTPQIQSLQHSPEHDPFLMQLEIFTWGTYKQYTTTTDLPPLNDAQTTKLRLLSLLSLFSSSGPDYRTYKHLQSELSLPATQSLESLLTHALSSSLITGHLDPFNQRVLVTSVAPLRDLAPRSALGLATGLEFWEGGCVAALFEIDAQVRMIEERAKARGEKYEAQARELADILAEMEAREGPDTGPRGASMGQGYPGNNGGGSGMFPGSRGYGYGGRSGKNGKRPAGFMGENSDAANFHGGGRGSARGFRGAKKILASRGGGR